MSPSTFRPLIFHFIGRQENVRHAGYGLLHLLFNPDWFIRKASVDSLRCVMLLFAEDLTMKKKTLHKIRDRLQKQRFDRVPLTLQPPFTTFRIRSKP